MYHTTKVSYSRMQVTLESKDITVGDGYIPEHCPLNYSICSFKVGKHCCKNYRYTDEIEGTVTCEIPNTLAFMVEDL